MTTSTEHFGLTKLAPNEGVHAGSGRYPSADRDTIDQALYDFYTHHHNGEGVADAPTTAPVVSVSTTGGTIPASTTIRYKYTITDPTTGESQPSPESVVTTPDPLNPPAAPTLTQSAGGSLEPGTYYYVLTAYQGSSTVETKGPNVAELVIPADSSTNTITITFPAKPVGATGFNIYRRGPNQITYSHLVTVPDDGSTSYVDDGTGISTYDVIEYDGSGIGSSANLGRTLPSKNTTNSTNSIQVSLPGAIPVGNQWTIYRTYTVNFSDSFLRSLTDDITSYVDTGLATAAGSPPSITLASPDKIYLTDGAEVQGTLPMALATFPHSVEFAMPGPVTVMTGTGAWVCEFPYAEIVAVRASLGRGSTPASTPVIVDVLRGTATAVPTYTTIFPTTANPLIMPGDQIGARVVPDNVSMLQGESLVVNIDQAGGGDPPTDRDLIVTISMILYGYPVTTFIPANPAVTPGSF